MREQKIKSLPLFPNTGETKFTANYLYAVRTPLPSGGVGGGLPPLSHSFGRGWGWVFSPPIARRANVKSRPYLSAGQ